MTTTAAERAQWVQQGSVDASRKTYEAVRNALALSSELDTVDYDVFLQGSYANSTNTRGDSDVDVVVMMYSTFMANTSELTLEERANHERARIPGTTSAAELRSMVKGALLRYFGEQRVESKNKCLKVAKTSGYVDADVVPALQERLFTSYPAAGSAQWIEGISIQPVVGGRIVNYPKEHIRRGREKNQRTSGHYKPTVRQVKRLRRRAVDLGLLDMTDAPGYLLECLVSNAPDGLFVYDPSERLMQVLAHLHSFTAEDLKRHMWSGDKIHKLFVTDPGGHNEYTAARALDTLWELL